MLVISIDQVCSKQQKTWKKQNFVEKNNTKKAICGPRPRLIILIVPAGAGEKINPRPGPEPGQGPGRSLH